MRPQADQSGDAYKFIVIGSSGVGKTAILTRLVDHVFTGESQSTIGVEFIATQINVEGSVFRLQIWDTAGQERFRAIAKAYFRSAIGVMLVFDLTDRKSFDDLNGWLNDVHAHCDPNVVVTLIGNKSDLENSRKVSESEARAFADLHQLQYLETSALDGSNVELAFQTAASNVLRKLDTVKEMMKRRPESVLEERDTQKESDCC